MVRSPALALVLSITGGACSPDSPPRASPPPPISVPGGGTLYLVAGERSLAADLYRLESGRIALQRLTRLAPRPGVSWITAGSGEVMVSAAPELTDKIYKVTPRGLELFIDGAVFSPALSEDGRLAYNRLTYSESALGAGSTYAIIVRDLKTSSERRVYESKLPHGAPVWGPAGSIAAIQHNADYLGGRLLVFEPSGNVRTMELGLFNPTYFHWSTRGVIAMNNKDASGITHGFLLDSFSGDRQALAPGWRTLAWSPDGSALLVGRDRRIGIVRPSNPSAVTDVATVPLPVWTAVWIAP